MPTNNANTRREPGAALINTHTRYFKRFPAFGHQLDELRKQGLIPAKRIIVAFDWSIGKLFPRIIITDDAPVTGLKFNYLAGLHVQIAYSDRNAAILPELVNEILTVKPATLSVFNISAVTRGEPAFHTIHRSQSISEEAAA